MASAKSKYRFFKLGNSNASVFVDSKSQLKVTKTLPGKVLALQTRNSKKIQIALSNKHLAEITESEYETMMKVYSGDVETSKTSTKTKKVEVDSRKAKETELRKMRSKDELYTYLVDSFEVTEDQKAAFKELKYDEMIEQLLDYELDEEADVE